MRHAAQPPPPTIKDLDKASRSTSGPIRRKGVDAAKTMDSYKRFLDLNSGDAALRAEALRRLGDLHLESSESERIERELATNEGLHGGEAIALYGALLKAYPKYERNDSVLYQLARAYELNAQPDKALARSIGWSRIIRQEPLHRRGAIPARRAAVLDKQYPAAQSAYEAVIKFGPASAFYNQSLYKHGWSLFKQGENERSLESFAGVLDAVLVSKSTPPALVEIDTLSRAEPRTRRGHVSGHVHHLFLLDGPKTSMSS
jgi:cellulose synthase operon protein C